MKVLNDLSVKDLKLNRKRSIVIIIGIILSTALICGVAGLVTSFQQSMIDVEKQDNGDYHAMFYDVPKEELKYIEQNRNVEKYYLSESLGCSYFEERTSDKVAYLNVISMEDKFLNNMGINVKEGRLPENGSELVISERINQNSKVEYKVGDTITLNIGKRQLTDGTELNENNPYNRGEDENGNKEELVDVFEKTYTIVGIIERPSTAIEPYDTPWFTVITKMERVKEKANIAVTYKNVFKYQKYTESINEMVKAETDEEKENATEFAGMRDATYKSYKYRIALNTYLLAYEGVNLSDDSVTTIYGLGAIIMVIVLVSSVFVIRNGFAISVTERLKQYGMLSSIGATKKQIKKSVYFEGFILGLIGIPLGVLGGVLAIFILVNVVNFILKDFVSSGTLLTFSISWGAIVISIIVSIVTIWLSCKSSAKKASKVTPIEAIRSTQDIKLNAKNIKCPKIITKIFKTGGEIAYKNLKRSKKKYRTTVISIIVSVVMFIAISSFIQYGFKMSGAYYTEIDYNFGIAFTNVGTFVETDEERIEQEKENYNILEEIANLENVEKYSNQRRKALIMKYDENQLTEYGKMIKPKPEISENADNTENLENLENLEKTENAEEIYDNVTIVSLGKQEYERFIKKVGGNYEKYKDGAILIDDSIFYNSEGKKVNGSLYNWQKGSTVKGTINEKEYEIKILEKIEERPMGFEELYTETAYLIVSDEFMDNLGIYNSGELLIQAKDTYKLEEEINEYMEKNQISSDKLYMANLEESARAQNSIVLVISIFLYGFITVITLIGITNIFNTITTNMNLRRKEFANLKSIGMTKKEFNRMIRLESIFYGIKSLIIGIPIGVLLSYGMYKMFENSMEMAYTLPWKAILISIVFVVVVIGIIMKYSMSKINKQNIIETIRNDNI